MNKMSHLNFFTSGGLGTRKPENPKTRPKIRDQTRGLPILEKKDTIYAPTSKKFAANIKDFKFLT